MSVAEILSLRWIRSSMNEVFLIVQKSKHYSIRNSSFPSLQIFKVKKNWNSFSSSFMIPPIRCLRVESVLPFLQPRWCEMLSVSNPMPHLVTAWVKYRCSSPLVYGVVWIRWARCWMLHPFSMKGLRVRWTASGNIGSSKTRIFKMNPYGTGTPWGQSLNWSPRHLKSVNGFTLFWSILLRKLLLPESLLPARNWLKNSSVNPMKSRSPTWFTVRPFSQNMKKSRKSIRTRWWTNPKSISFLQRITPPQNWIQKF